MFGVYATLLSGNRVDLIGMNVLPASKSMANQESSSRIFAAAFVWNLFWGAPLLLVPDLAMTNLGLPKPVPGAGELLARAGGLAIVLFGWIYLTIGKNPALFRPFLLISVIAKVTFFLLVAVMYIQYRELLAMLLTAVGDLVFGALFYRHWRGLRRRLRRSGNEPRTTQIPAGLAPVPIVGGRARSSQHDSPETDRCAAAHKTSELNV